MKKEVHKNRENLLSEPKKMGLYALNDNRDRILSYRIEGEKLAACGVAAKVSADSCFAAAATATRYRYSVVTCRQEC